MRQVKPPCEIQDYFPRPYVFLAGSIEMGEAPDWQEHITRGLAYKNGTLLNPRRDDWDSSWEQSIDNPHFREQVEWELTGLDKSDFIFMYFAPGTKSPISLLELGLLKWQHGLVVCCPNGFWRKGNVDIVCAKYEIEQVNSLDDFLKVDLTNKF